MIKPRQRWLWVAVSLLLTACGAEWRVVPGEYGHRARASSQTHRVVAAGDTLYSIAWESGRDYQQLAAWNGIKPPYLIKPGQKLRLSPSGSARNTRASSRWYTVKSGDTLFSIAQAAEIPYRTLAARNRIKSPYVIKPGQRLRLDAPVKAASSRRAHGKKPVRRTQTAAVHNSRAAGVRIRHWRWPTKGRVLYGFDSKKGRKGIDIAGKKGQSIVAAASGRVVYQGSGLRGYGKLIIIKHNEDYLSAYAHCDKIYAKEGDVLKRGQSIAAMGSTGASRVKLHFEIRYRGNPVNPLKYLPKK